MKSVSEHLTERPRSWFEYEVKGLEKRDNRFAADDDGLYMNGKLCWPVEPVTCLKPNGETEPCESRQIPPPKSRPTDAPPAVPIPKTVLYRSIFISHKPLIARLPYKVGNTVQPE